MERNDMTTTRWRQYMLASAGIACALGVFILTDIYTLPYPTNTTTALAAEAILTPSDPYAEIVLDAHAAIVVDLSEGKVLYEKNASTQLPLASLTKLMTVLVANKHLQGRNTISISNSALGNEGDSGLLLNETWRIPDLIDFTLMVSSNDGAAALAELAGGREAFVEDMNATARELGLTQSFYLNETGLDASASQSGAYGSARDTGKLLSYITSTYPSLLSATTISEKTFTTSEGFIHTAINTNEALPAIPGLISGKTGFTDLAGGNLAVVFDAGINHTIVVIVLHSTKEGRFNDVSALIARTLSSLSTAREY